LGDKAFARTPKVSSDGEPLAAWDIHFREYTLPTVLELIADLPDATVVDAGFVANGPSGRSRAIKNLALTLIRRSGLGKSRLLSATEYLVVRRG
jgi:hypothetical protein